jgi:hypothetical protein
VSKASIEKTIWREVRTRIHAISPALADHIDDLPGSADLPLYQASYPYGSYIGKNGVFYLPTSQGTLAPLDSGEISETLQNELGYVDGKIPTGIVLSNSAELFLDSSHHTLPWALLKPGSLLGIWQQFSDDQTYHPTKVFSMTAGARNLYMLPNISNASLHQNLVHEFNLKVPAPKSLLEQWPIFQALANHSDHTDPWKMEILFLPKVWMEKLQHDARWVGLRNYLLSDLFQKSDYPRNLIFYNFWLSQVQHSNNLKPNPYLVDTAKHLLCLITSFIPGFQVAKNDIAGPVKLLQDIYINHYKLKHYIPSMMHPSHFSYEKDSAPIYYSFQTPTTVESSPKSRQLATKIQELRELQQLFSIITNEILVGKHRMEETLLAQRLAHTDIEFFHNKPDNFGRIQLTSELPKEEKQLLQYPSEYGIRLFADNGAFVRGCIRIKRK